MIVFYKATVDQCDDDEMFLVTVPLLQEDDPGSSAHTEPVQELLCSETLQKEQRGCYSDSEPVSDLQRA